MKNMQDEIRELKEKFGKAASEKEIKAIEKRMDELSNNDPVAFSESMLSLMKESNQQADELIIREKMKDILSIVSIAYIAKQYFGKTRTWLYQRINGNIVNGKPARFTEDEIKTLKTALTDISQKIGSISYNL